jgi:hydrogenase maturation protease
MILIACIGNIFLGDDGFGVEVARELATRRLPSDVIVKDFGIRGFDLGYALLDHSGLTILVDACPRGAEPGTIYLVEPEMSGSAEPVALPETHSMNPMRVLDLVRNMSGAPKRVLLVGCEPLDFGPENEGRMGLSEPVQAAVSEAVALIERLIQEHTEGRQNVHGIEHTFI